MNTQIRNFAPKDLRLSAFVAIAVLLLAFGARAAQNAGELDRSFNPTITADSTSIVQSLVVHPDGKTIVGGTFLKINNQQVNHVARFNADGTLDATFDAGGAVVGNVSNLALQPDGKIIVVGAFEQVARQIRYKITRLNADGSFDASFDANINRNLANINAVAVQSDGKFLIGGSISIGNPSATFTAGLVRLNSDGSRDTTFAPPSGSPGSIAVQTDGKILIAGSSFALGGQIRAQVARLNPNGSFDTSFVGTTYDSTVFAAVPRADGKIYVGGAFQTVGGQQRRGLALLNADGTRDDSFADAANSRSGIRKIAVQSDGKPVFCGEGTFSNAVRANLDGSADTAFVTRSRLNGGVYAVGVLPDDRVVVGGDMDVFNAARTDVEKRRFVVLAADGTIDDAVNPYINGSFGASFDGAFVIVQPDGKILYSDRVFTEVNRAARRRIVRLNADGTTDTTFNLAANLFESATRITALALQSDGKILFATTRTNNSLDRRVGRLNSDGTLDNSFADITGNNNSSITVTRIAIQPNGQIIIKGFFSGINGQARDGAARLNADGSLDSFVIAAGLRASNPSANDTLVQPDGKFLIAVVNNSGLDKIARFNQDGSLDASFATPNNANVSTPLALQPDGKVICLSSGVVRLNADGSIDNTFVASGYLINNTSTAGFVSTAIVTSSGKILVGGQFNLVRINFGTSQPRNGFVRLNQDGTLDNTFGANGGAITSTDTEPSSLALVSRIALQPDGKALIAGVIRYVNNFSQHTLARLKTSASNTTPTVDFDADGRADASVFRNGTWYVNRSTNGFLGIQFGIASDKIAPADYDGDGRTDIAVWRENVSGVLAYFYILNSSNNTVRIEQFGNTNDVLTVGDWDGDGRADPSVYRDSAAGAQNYFYYAPSTQPSVKFVSIPWGTTNDKPVRGDFDGDGKFDAAVFRPLTGTWIISQSSNAQVVYRQFGLGSDKLVPADYDGDGKTDLAIYRSGLWIISQSQSNQIRYANFGLGSDKLVPADYDGDGKTDLAVYRDGLFIILQSSNSAIVYQQFGLPGDVPIGSAYVQ